MNMEEKKQELAFLTNAEEYDGMLYFDNRGENHEWIRNYFAEDNADGEFVGKVTDIFTVVKDGVKSFFLFFETLDLSFTCMDYECTHYDATEYNVWAEIDTADDISEGSIIAFNASAFVYLNQQGKQDGCLIDLRNIKTVSEEEYQKEHDEKKEYQKKELIRRLICNACLFNEHCGVACLANEEWYQDMEKFFIAMIEKMESGKLDMEQESAEYQEQNTDTAKEKSDKKRRKNHKKKKHHKK